MSMRLKKAMIEYARKNWEDITESGDPEAVALYAEIIEAIA